MSGVVVFLVLVTLSIIVNRVAGVALTITGLPRDAASFQARSAFSGVGFTTNEAERVVNHPARRRIVMALMLAGNAGLVTAVSSLVFAVLDTSDVSSATLRAALLVGGLLCLYLLTRSRATERVLRHAIERGLRRWTDLDVRDYASLLNVSGDYDVVDLDVSAGSWLADRPLGGLRLRDEGVLVLAVRRRDGHFVGVPSDDVVPQAGDTVVTYGREERLRELVRRVCGDSGEGAP